MTERGGDDDFEAMLEASLAKPARRVRAGDRVKGTVTRIGQDVLVLDLGGGLDGLLERKALGPAGSRPEVREGDELEAYVLRFEDRTPVLGMRSGGGVGVAMEDAFRSGVPVSGMVTEVNRGGFVVEVGSTRCFCPLGSMDTRRIEDPATYVGRKLEFRVTEMKGPRDVVLSRRVLLEEEASRRAAATRAALVVGARLPGVVTNVRDFGAFVDLGGVEGLVPASELGHGWMKPQDVVAPGQAVDVVVIAVAGPEQASGPASGRAPKERITLSMKALQADPFEAAADALTPGTILAGTVRRVQPFGAFVELVPGVEGLIHVSAFGRRIGHPSEVVKVGQEVAVRVEGLDRGARRISLQHADQAELGQAPEHAPPRELRVIRRADPEPRREAERQDAPEPRIGDVFDVTVDKAEAWGLFVSWPTGRGLLPARELGLGREVDLRRRFSAGTALRVALIAIRDDGKLTLSRIAVERAEERADTEEYLKQVRQDSPRGLGSLGEALRDMEDRRGG